MSSPTKNVFDKVPDIFENLDDILFLVVKIATVGCTVPHLADYLNAFGLKFS